MGKPTPYAVPYHTLTGIIWWFESTTGHAVPVPPHRRHTMFAKLARALRALLPTPPHSCPQCQHVLPSHRARFHAGQGNYISIRQG